MTNSKSGVFSGLLLCVFLLLTKSITAQLPTSNQQILKQTINIYTSLSTYQDHGLAEKAVKDHTGASYISTTNFSTFISRPRKLRLEWTDSRFPTYGQSFLTYNQQQIGLFLAWRNQHVLMDDSDRNWGIIFGISGEQSYAIPSLMSIGYASSALERLQNLQLISIQDFEGTLCYVLTGQDVSINADYELWIGRNDYLLRRVEYKIKSVNNTQQQQKAKTTPDNYSISFKEIFRDIKINQPIAEEAFQFQPPKQSLFVRPDDLISQNNSNWVEIYKRIKNLGILKLAIIVLFLSTIYWIIFAIRRNRLSAKEISQRH